MPGFRHLQRSLRAKRLRSFLQHHKPDASTRILDIGGTPPTWSFPETRHLSASLLNIHPRIVPESEAARIANMTGDATAMPFEDDSFDLAFSNSVIEHVGTLENQKKFAAEARRVAKALWIQTPAREFFFEPHYFTPFIHWIPKSIRPRFVRWFTFWGWSSRPSKAQIQDQVEELRLLSYREMKDLFPDCEILRERFMGMTKSYIATRQPGS
ncbi:MAG: methyltransferase domain-containing protein [Verrucomicrobiota bacterium]